MEILGYIASVIMGLSLGLLGGGGSILTVPILYYLFDQDSVTATSNSLFIVGSIGLVGGLLSARKGTLRFKTAALFALPSFAGVYAARALLIPLLPETLFSIAGFELTKTVLIMISFASVMILASLAMIRSTKNSSEKSEKERSEQNSSLFQVSTRGFGVGFVTGFVGAGGGFLIVPALTLLLKLSMEKAIGTSLAIIAANSFFGFFVSSELRLSEVSWSLLLTISGLGIGGMLVGQLLTSKVSEHKLKKGFGYFVLIFGALVLLDQLHRSV